MNRVELYKKAKKNLEEYAKNCGITTERLKTAYYNPREYDEHRYKSKKSFYFFLFCEHLADRQVMGNIVKFYKKDNDHLVTQEMLKKLLCDWNVSDVVKMDFNELYSKFEVTTIYKSKIEQYNNTVYFKKGKDIDTKNEKERNKKKEFYTKMWKTYLCGIYQMAHYLNEGFIPCFDSKFNKCNNILASNLPTSEYLFNSKINNEDDLKRCLNESGKIAKHIKGVGTAVLCNWLKECGITFLAKPDLHIMRIVRALEKNDNLSEEDTVVYMYNWAIELKITAYELDRILYLYCTNGNFYMDRDKTISEENLLAMIKEK